MRKGYSLERTWQVSASKTPEAPGLGKMGSSCLKVMVGGLTAGSSLGTIVRDV